MRRKAPVQNTLAHGMQSRSNKALIALRRILRVTELNSRNLARQSDLTTSQLLLIKHVAQNGQALPSAIARAIELKQATITALINKLEEDGLVTRSRDTRDRRRVWVRLTDAGQDVLGKSPDLLQNHFERGFERLDEWEQSMIIAALERIASLLDAEKVDAAPVLDVGDLDRHVTRK
jgi:DNA-binding MarR family transcriptional regulator